MFPKSSGPPPTPPTSTAVYIRQRVEQEVTQRLAATPLPPPPPPPEPALVTLSDGNVSIQIHEAHMAERCLQLMTERVAQAVLRDGSGTPRRSHVISTPPALPVLQASSPPGPGTWELPWSCLQVPNMDTFWYRLHSDCPAPCGDSLDLAHRFMPEAFTLPSISGLEVYDFPWKDPKQEHWYMLERIVMQIRPKLMRDSYRLRTAADAWGNFCRMLILIFRQLILQ
ncbi:argB [Symbiodinium sp. CCMP2592]|nr:argB [Symbiodinium sp. CCMP2592]